MEILLCASGDCQDVYEASNLKDLHNRFVDVKNGHLPLLVHDLLCGKQHPQTGG